PFPMNGIPAQDGQNPGMQTQGQGIMQGPGGMQIPGGMPMGMMRMMGQLRIGTTSSPRTIGKTVDALVKAGVPEAMKNNGEMLNAYYDMLDTLDQKLTDLSDTASCDKRKGKAKQLCLDRAKSAEGAGAKVEGLMQLVDDAVNAIPDSGSSGQDM